MRYIAKITGNEIVTPISSIKETVIPQIVARCKVELAHGKALTMNNLFEIYKSRISEYSGKDERADGAIRIDLAELYRDASVTRWMVSNCRIRTCIDNQRLVTNDLTAFAQEYAEDSSLGNEDEMALLAKAVMISRKGT